MRQSERQMTGERREMSALASVYAWDSRLRALGFQHRLHRQVASLRVLGEVLLWPELILQSLGKVSHLLSRGCLECDLGDEGFGGGGVGVGDKWHRLRILQNVAFSKMTSSEIYPLCLGAGVSSFDFRRLNLFPHMLSYSVPAALCFEFSLFSHSLFPALSIMAGIYGRLPACLAVVKNCS